jgi:type IV pilus assembly protein PilF
MMKMSCRSWFLVCVASALMLAGCASNTPNPDQGNLSTSSDRTDNQKRARIRLQLAVGYYQQHQMEVALDEIKRALQAEPDFADAYSMRGLIYMDMGENNLAESDFRAALKLSPGNPDFSNNYGWLLCQTGRERQSISYFETAFNNRTYESPAKAYNNAGICSLRLKDKAAALRYFSDAFQHDPANAKTNYNLAQLYYGRGDYERAHFYISRVIKADVMPADVLWLATKIAHKKGDRAAEESFVTQLRRRYPASAEYAAYERGAFDE